MNLAFRVLVYAAVLVPIAVVIVGQQHDTAAATLRAVPARLARWYLHSGLLVAAILLLQFLFID